MTVDAPLRTIATQPSDATIEKEPGSYRDRNGAVFYRDGRVFRYLNDAALTNWQCLQQAPFFQQERKAGGIVDTWPVDAQKEGLPQGEWAGVLEHARVPFISYPYEWTFGMLKDAALLHLQLMRSSLACDMILRDASSYNIQWRGARPVFIDIPSFEPLRHGEPWVGYRQFCELFLYPLMLQAFKGTDFRPWLRGRIDGIPAEEMRKLMSARDMLRPGVLLHVVAHNALKRRYSDSRDNMRETLAETGFEKGLIERNVDRLIGLVSKLTPRDVKTEWADYDRTHSYDEADFKKKQEFVRAATATERWRLAWDMGCNTGTFSRIIAEHADSVVAMDGDWMAIEQLYQRERASETSRAILPLVVNFADSSPGQGWRGAERKSLVERGKPQLTLCLALIHHIVISANIPLADFISWLAELRTAVVIEFVGRDDEMVQALLANREDQYADYYPDKFRELLTRHFDIRAEQALKGGKRHIYFAQPR